MGNKKLLLTLIVLLYSQLVFSKLQQKTNIDSLANAADAVVLGEHITVNIHDLDDIEYSYKAKILIKNSNADDYCKVSLTETEFKSIDDIQATIYDTTGKVIKKLDDDDIKSAEIIPGYKYYSSEKYRWFSLSSNQYPFIIEYSYKENISSLFLWPDYYPQFSVPLLSGSYTLNIIKDIKFNYYQKGTEIKFLKKTNDDNLTYVWEVKDLPGRIKEDFMPPEDADQNVVYFSPDSFKVRDYAGNLTSWTSVGNWYKKLTAGRYKLPPKAIDELNAILSNTTDTNEKLEKIYKYMQATNRYVAIDLGISGWQPQSASEVYQNHYGDCKDLTTYMVAMLRSCGIKSYPALALTRDDGVVNVRFPSNQFNHCIAYVPIKNDTLWLECTGQFLNIGDMPSEIQGIDALVITDNNPKLLKTPIRKADSNKWCTKINATLTSSGSLVFNANLLTTGNQKEYFKANLGIKNNEEDLEFLNKNFSKYYSGLNIQRYSIVDSNQNNFAIKVIGTYNNFMNPSGRLVFINPNILNRRSPNSLPKEKPEKRIFPVFNNFPYIDIDTVEITLPETFTMQSKPKDLSISKEFGNYNSSYKMIGNRLFFSRKFELKEREIPVKDYKEYKEFLKEVIKNDKSPIVFKRSTF